MLSRSIPTIQTAFQLLRGSRAGLVVADVSTVDPAVPLIVSSRTDRYRACLQAATDHDRTFRDWVRREIQDKRVDDTTELTLFHAALMQRWRSMVFNSGVVTAILYMLYTNMIFSNTAIEMHSATLIAGCLTPAYYSLRHRTNTSPWRRLMEVRSQLDTGNTTPPRLQL